MVPVLPPERSNPLAPDEALEPSGKPGLISANPADSEDNSPLPPLARPSTPSLPSPPADSLMRSLMRRAARFGVAAPTGVEGAQSVSESGQSSDQPEQSFEIDYRFKETIRRIDLGLGYLPPTTASPMAKYSQKNGLTGTTWGAGVGLLTDLSIYGNVGSARAGFDLDIEKLLSGEMDISKFIGLGELHYNIDNRRFGIGYWTFDGNGAHLPPPAILVFVILIQSLMSLAQTKIEDPKEIPGVIASEIVPHLIPANTVREFYNFLKFVFIGPGNDDSVETTQQFQEVMSFMSSYSKQKLVYTALNQLNRYLEATTDPYMRAQLMDMRDFVLYNMAGVNLPVTFSFHLDGVAYTTSGLMKEYQRRAVERVERFQEKHGTWLASYEGKAPSSEEIDSYMADVLYLTQKMQMTIEVQKAGDNAPYHIKSFLNSHLNTSFDMKEEMKTLYKIVSSTPFAIDDPEWAVRYLGVISTNYEYLASDQSGLYQYLSARLTGGVEQLFGVTRDLDESNEKVFKAKSHFDSTVEWVQQMHRMLDHYEMKRKHITWIVHVRGEESDKEKLLRDISKYRLLVSKDFPDFSGQLLSEENLGLDIRIYSDKFIVEAFQELEVVEAVRVQSYNPLAFITDPVSRGFDFTKTGEKREDINSSLAAVYDLYKKISVYEEAGWPGGIKIYDLMYSLWKRARKTLIETAKENPVRILWGVEDELEEDLSHLKKLLENEADDVVEAVNEIDDWDLFADDLSELVKELREMTHDVRGDYESYGVSIGNLAGELEKLRNRMEQEECGNLLRGIGKEEKRGVCESYLVELRIIARNIRNIVEKIDGVDRVYIDELKSLMAELDELEKKTSILSPYRYNGKRHDEYIKKLKSWVDKIKTIAEEMRGEHEPGFELAKGVDETLDKLPEVMTGVYRLRDQIRKVTKDLPQKLDLSDKATVKDLMELEDEVTIPLNQTYLLLHALLEAVIGKISALKDRGNSLDEKGKAYWFEKIEDLEELFSDVRDELDEYYKVYQQYRCRLVGGYMYRLKGGEWGIVPRKDMRIPLLAPLIFPLSE